MSKTINDLEKMLDKDIEASSLSGKNKLLFGVKFSISRRNINIFVYIFHLLHYFSSFSLSSPKRPKFYSVCPSKFLLCSRERVILIWNTFRKSSRLNLSTKSLCKHQSSPKRKSVIWKVLKNFKVFRAEVKYTCELVREKFKI